MRVLALLALFVPLFEVILMILVGQEIGALGVIGLLLLSLVAGIALLRWQGMESLRRVQGALQRGEVPLREIRDGFALVLAGVLFIVPGFLSDIAAILLLLPPVRRLVAVRLDKAPGAAGRKSGPTTIDAEEWVVEEEGGARAERRLERPHADRSSGTNRK